MWSPSATWQASGSVGPRARLRDVMPGGSLWLACRLTAGGFPCPWMARLRTPTPPSPRAELGVVFLLFNIGLELSFDRLRSMGKFVFGMGTLQVGGGGGGGGEEGGAGQLVCVSTPQPWPPQPCLLLFPGTDLPAHPPHPPLQPPWARRCTAAWQQASIYHCGAACPSTNPSTLPEPSPPSTGGAHPCGGRIHRHGADGRRAGRPWGNHPGWRPGAVDHRSGDAGKEGRQGVGGKGWRGQHVATAACLFDAEPSSLSLPDLASTTSRHCLPLPLTAPRSSRTVARRAPSSAAPRSACCCCRIWRWWCCSCSSHCWRPRPTALLVGGRAARCASWVACAAAPTPSRGPSNRCPNHLSAHSHHGRGNNKRWCCRVQPGRRHSLATHHSPLCPLSPVAMQPAALPPLPRPLAPPRSRLW